MVSMHACPCTGTDLCIGLGSGGKLEKGGLGKLPCQHYCRGGGSVFADKWHGTRSRFCSSHARLAGTQLFGCRPACCRGRRMPACLCGTFRNPCPCCLYQLALCLPSWPCWLTGKRAPGSSTGALPTGLNQAYVHGALNTSLGACVQSLVCTSIGRPLHFMSTYCRIVWTVDRAFLYQTMCSPIPPLSSTPKKYIIFTDFLLMHINFN